MRNRYHLLSAALAVTLLPAAVHAGGEIDACDADIDGSGVVDFFDLVQLIADWGPCPGCRRSPRPSRPSCSRSSRPPSGSHRRKRRSAQR